MKVLYKHKAICEYCKEQEFDGTWIRKTFELKRFGKNRKAEDFEEKRFHYICYKCLNMWFIQNDC
jgi:hypothetical protein